MVGGFNAKNKNRLSVAYICPKCCLILRNPVQISCGCRLCQTCVKSNRGIINCSKCKESTDENEQILDYGFTKHMETLGISCELCDNELLFKDYEKHLKEQHPTPVCVNCEEMFDSALSFFMHQRIGCVNRNVLRDFEHLKKSISVDGNNNTKTNSYNLSATAACNPTVQSNLTTTIGQQATHTNENVNSHLQELCETINILASGIETLNDDLQRRSMKLIQARNLVNTLSQAAEILQSHVAQQNAVINRFQLNQEILQQDAASLKQKVDDMQYVSFDGTLIWKITSFREQMMDAQSERQTSIYSPPFYSSPTGYKMRARLFLYGDGNARRTHMSLFFVLMRGSYDPILKFPFNYKVTFCLYDQTPSKNHVIDSFRPDIKSNSFQRPQTKMNIASGIPKFFPLSLIQQENNPYVQDDTMFIKVMVDFSGMPQTLLPFALSLNPGLPMSVQQAIIKQELERRSQQTSSLPIVPTNTTELASSNDAESSSTTHPSAPSPDAMWNNIQQESQR